MILLSSLVPVMKTTKSSPLYFYLFCLAIMTACGGAAKEEAVEKAKPILEEEVDVDTVLEVVEPRPFVKTKEDSIAENFQILLDKIKTEKKKDSSLVFVYRTASLPLTKKRNKLLEEVVGKQNSLPGIFAYLLNNYRMEGRVDSLTFSDYPGEMDYFVQKFTNGIIFKYDKLPELGTAFYCYFPSAEEEDLRDLVELLFADAESDWYGMVYGPEDGPGCYYTLKKEVGGYWIHSYCGC